MYLQANSIVLAIIGTLSLIGSKRVSDFMLGFYPRGHTFTRRPWRSLLYVWPMRLIGVMALGVATYFALSGFPGGGMASDKNRLALLERGRVTKAQVVAARYETFAPSGWEVRYSFVATDPATGNERTYLGSNQGPKKYYAHLSKGEGVVVVYDPNGPKVNCEIRCLVNHPSFRNTFKEAGKSRLVDRYRDQCEFEDYTFAEWYREQQQK